MSQPNEVNLPDRDPARVVEPIEDAVKPALETKQTKQPSSRPSHLLYAIEMLAFAAIGWAWLAVRELMGATPVMDVTVLLSLFVASGINLLLALYYHTPEEFRTSGQAFVNFAVCVWVLYAFALLESTTDGRSAVCCSQGGAKSTTYSLRLTYKAAYFGGLPLHQSAAAITLSFLTIFLILASAQARACMEVPREWPLGKAALALACLLCLQQAMLGVGAPVCSDKDLALSAAVLAGIALLLMVDMPWVFGLVYGGAFSSYGGVAVLPLVHIVQLLLEITFTLLLGVFAAVLAVDLGGGDALIVSMGLLLLWLLQQLVALLLKLRRPAAEEAAPSAPPMPEMPGQAVQMGTHFLPQRAMLLPSVRDLRRAHAGAKKAW